MINIIQISQFGFSTLFAAPTLPANSIVGWTSVAALQDNILVSVPDASSAAPEQLFNSYFFELPPNTQGQAFMLQSLLNGKYVVAQTKTIAGANYTVFTATGDSRDGAAQFGVFALNQNVSYLWKNPTDKKWYGLLNIACADFGGTGVVAASTIAYDQPYLLPWQANQSATKWNYRPPGKWNVSNGSDLSYVDFTSVAATDFPFDFTNCRMNMTNLLGKNFAHALFNKCDLTTAQIAPPLGANDGGWINFSESTLNYPSLGPDWRFLNLTKAIVNKFPAAPTPPPQINAQGSILDYLNMIQWNLSKADFSNAQLYNTNLQGSYLSGAKFHGAKLSPANESPSGDSAVPANLAYAYLFNCDFSNALLQGVNFAYSFLYGKAATVSGSSLREANFSNAFLAEIDFTGVYKKDLVGVNFDGACLASANFEGSILGKIKTKGFSFVGAALQGADFSGSNLEGANLSNAAIAITDPPAGGSTLAVTATFHLGDYKISITPITYTSKTIMAPTDDSTYCPSGGGPCVGNKLTPADPNRSPLKSWPVAATYLI